MEFLQKLAFYASATDRCVEGIMFSGPASVSASVRTSRRGSC